MTQADSVHSTPPTNTSADTTLRRPARPADAAIAAGLAKQQRDRDRALKRVARLRKRAADEIERLLSFLDESDQYVMTEREDDNDQNDVSYPEGGPRTGFSLSNEDDEPSADDEPSLGSSGHGDAGAIIYMVHTVSDGSQMIYDCEGDEHDGREPDDDAEPSVSGLTSDRCADASAMGVV
jgi:hypothetical protein